MYDKTPKMLKRQYPLSMHLVFIVTCVGLPLIAFAAFNVYFLLSAKQELELKNLVAGARELSQKVDQEAEATIRSLVALQSSQALQSGDLNTFYQEARRAVSNEASFHSIILFSSERQALLNTRFDLGLQPQAAVEPESLELVFQKKAAVVGNVRAAPDGDLAFAIRIPVFVAGELKYVLTAVQDLKVWQNLVTVNSNQPRIIWTQTIVDRKGVVVARSRAPAEFVGKLATPSFIKKMGSRSESVYEEETLDKVPVYLALFESPMTGWTSAIAVSKNELLMPVRLWITRISAWGLFFWGGFGGLAFVYGYRVSKSFRRLNDAAASLALGNSSGRQVFSRNSLPNTKVLELSELARVLEETSRILHEQEAEIDAAMQLLKQQRADAEAANEAKDCFLAMLGHELRNPMSAVISSLELLRELVQSNRPEIEEIQNIMSRQLSLANKLLQDLLDISRISRGKVTLNCEVVDFKEVVFSSLNDCAHSFRQKEISLVLNSIERPVWIFADRARLAQVIGNVLHNAQKFTPNSGKVTVTLTECQGSVLLDVVDSGPGFDNEILPRLFEPFAQSSQDFARSHGGLGLGLSIVKNFVELHGGTISAKNSEAGQGASIMISFPTCSPPRNEAGTLNTVPRLKKHEVLLIEDNIDAAEMLRMLFLLEGHSVTVAHTGAEGLLCAKNRCPDVVFCDLGLPDLDGFEVCRRLRLEPQTCHAHIVAISGYGLKEHKEKAKEVGFNLHLTKPIEFNSIRKALAAACAPFG